MTEVQRLNTRSSSLFSPSVSYLILLILVAVDGGMYLLWGHLVEELCPPCLTTWIPVKPSYYNVSEGRIKASFHFLLMWETVLQNSLEDSERKLFYEVTNPMNLDLESWFHIMFPIILGR